MQPEGPIIDGFDRIIDWGRSEVTAARTEVQTVRAEVRGAVADVGHDIKLGFWLVYGLLILFSPPVRWLFTRKTTAAGS